MYNTMEANFIFKLTLAILRQIMLCKDLHEDSATLPRYLPEKQVASIGVITFYRGQKQELIRRFEKFHQGALLKYVDINTVDVFQDQEHDIVILSCVLLNSWTLL